VHTDNRMEGIDTTGLTPSKSGYEASKSGIIKIKSNGVFWVSEQYC